MEDGRWKGEDGCGKCSVQLAVYSMQWPLASRQKPEIVESQKSESPKSKVKSLPSGRLKWAMGEEDVVSLLKGTFFN